MELELSVKVEAQVPPIELGRQGRSASEGRVPQVDAWERLIAGAREMKELRLRGGVAKWKYQPCHALKIALPAVERCWVQFPVIAGTISL